MRYLFNRRAKGASLAEVGLLIGLIAILLIGSLTSVGQQLQTLFGTTGNTLSNAAAGLPISTQSDQTYASCKEWSDAADANFTDNGVNKIYPNGASTPINVYCQGAKTLILAQYEDDPVTDWNEGIQADYDPTLATEKGFALSTSEIPSHSKIYFGQDLATPAYCILRTYNTGTISVIRGPYKVTAQSCDTASTLYYIYRSSSTYMGWHNPDNGYDGSNPVWSNTLSLELAENSAGTAPENNFNWAFSPMQTTINARGYSYLGTDYQTVYNGGTAWTVWVE